MYMVTTRIESYVIAFCVVMILVLNICNVQHYFSLRVDMDNRMEVVDSRPQDSTLLRDSDFWAMVVTPRYR